jgi:hypothetical protein
MLIAILLIVNVIDLRLLWLMLDVNGSKCHCTYCG